jgi:predicted nucleotidyltransferase
VIETAMAKQTVVNIIRDYLRAVNQVGIRASRAILFGSWIRNEARADSDIDLVVIAPEFDKNRGRELIGKLWELRIETPEAWRIEPIACGEREWVEDDSRAIIEIARREGEVITLEPETV